MPTTLYGTETWSMPVAEKKIKCNGDEVSDEYMWSSNMYGLSEK